MVGARAENRSHSRIHDLEAEKREIEDRMREMERDPISIRADKDVALEYHGLKARLAIVCTELETARNKGGRRK